MLLESKVLVGEGFYSAALDRVIDAYFIDYENNASEFVPAYLFNDILRMWRTFCVNYEYYKNRGSSKAKVKNVKLKYSRMLTCYSAIIDLLAAYSQNGTVHKQDVRDMIALTPTERLEKISKPTYWNREISPQLYSYLDTALKRYTEFLEMDHRGKDEVAKEFETNHSKWRKRSYEFAKSLADIMETINTNAPHRELFRYILI